MKERNMALCFGALFLAVTLLYAALFGAAERALSPTLPVGGEETPVIILDAGHGGEDGGATGTNGTLEKELNLAVTGHLAALLRLAGYTVVETRTEDKLLYSEGTKKGHKKQSDLENRLAFTERYPSGVFVSIHMNTFPIPDCRGVQVWYSQNHPHSRVLAERIQKGVVTALQPENRRKIKGATSNIYILRHAQAPAVLIECGFLSTPDDCEKLCDPAYQRSLAAVFFAALTEKSCKAGANMIE